jgi:CDP-diacylglycerol--inositol 3-phosphatidyltransferase
MSKSEVEVRIALFIPNIIDYIRLILSVSSFKYAKTHPNAFLFMYFFSYLLDEFDGMLARRYNQISNFGGILDMIVDRISTAALLATLSILYPEYYFTFMSLMMLDIGSHWLQTHSALLEVGTKSNHKSLQEQFWLLTIYYQSRLALSLIGWFAEIFLAQVYYLFFFNDSYKNPLFMHLLYISFPFYLLKQIISILQIFSASNRIIGHDLKNFQIRNEITGKCLDD